MTIEPDVKALDPYLENGYKLIPLHHYSFIDSRGRERGKSPVDGKWTKKDYNSKDQIAHMKSGKNVGVRLLAGDLVLDVDPRAFPEGETLQTKDNPFIRFCTDCGLDPDTCPTVETGSGGLHLYMRKPEDVSIKDSVPDYPGVEFKTLGRQVVSAGSIHPSTKRLYKWSDNFFNPSLDGRPTASDRLLNIIKRPIGIRQTTGGGEYDQEQIAEMLDVLDPEDFSEHSEWFSLMQACHHASAGDARLEFVEWSTRDPRYQDAGNEISKRWDSLHRKPEGGKAITYKTLWKVLTDKGQAKAIIPLVTAEDDFDDEPEFNRESPEVKRILEKGDEAKETDLEMLKRTCIAVLIGGKAKIGWKQKDPDRDDGREFWNFVSYNDFHQHFSYLNKVEVPVGEKFHAVPATKAWLESSSRREQTKSGVVFNPEKEFKDYLNLWTGWGKDPVKKKDGWSLLQQLILEGLAAGDEKCYDYILDWCANMFQNPATPGQVAICFGGSKGAGKSTLGNVLLECVGRHSMHITDETQLTGRFNSHLRDMVFLFSDEALNAYDPKADSALKGLITERRLAYEQKGVDVASGLNCIHIMMASNENWFVRAGIEERRYFVTTASNRFKGDTEFFDALYAQLAEGGYEAFLFDMLQRDILAFNPQRDIPVTEALIDQKLMNSGPVVKWWYQILQEGELPFTPAPNFNDNWMQGPIKVFDQEIRDCFKKWCSNVGIKPGAGGTALDDIFWRELGKLIKFPGGTRNSPQNKKQAKVPEDKEYDVKAFANGTAWCTVLPSLEQCKKDFESVVGMPDLKFSVPDLSSDFAEQEEVSLLAENDLIDGF